MLKSHFLKTRVARRILLLFLVCAVLPLLVLAGLGYRRLANDLESTTQAHLHDQAKTTGMMLLDRLNALAMLLETVAAQLPSDRPLTQPDDVSRALRFRALAMAGADGSVTTLSGEAFEPPALSAEQSAFLDNDGVLLLETETASGIDLFLVRNVAALPGTRLWGVSSAFVVFGADPSSSIAPTETLLCLTTENGADLACQTPETKTGTGTTFHWRRINEDYLAARWTLFLRRQYFSPSWIVTLSIPDAIASGPLVSLRRGFLSGLALALVLVFALAHIQLRRTMGPLEALEAATRRVAVGQFDQPVTVKSKDEFGALADSFNKMTRDLGHQFHYQAALARVHEAALSAAGQEAVLVSVIREQSTLLPGSAIGIVLATEDANHWTVIWGSNGAVEGGPFEVRPSAEEIRRMNSRSEGFTLTRGEPTPAYFGMNRPPQLEEAAAIFPLRSKGELSGALIVLGSAVTGAAMASSRRAVDEVALAISNTGLITQLEELNWGALTALARAIDAVSPWTAGHSERVTLGALEIGRRLSLSESDIKLLHQGGLLHDVGKVGVPVGILDKPGKLTPDEFDLIKGHPVIGAKILAPIAAFRSALPLVLHHHELLDGSGYPHGLKGDQIPLLVRVMTVADVFDALVSERPYRSAWPAEQALDYLRANVGTKFDARAVEALGMAVQEGWRASSSPSLNLFTDQAAKVALWPTPA